MNLEAIKKEAFLAIKKAQYSKELNKAYKRYLGKRGKISQLFKSLKDLPEKERPEIGQKLNRLKEELEERIKERQELLGSLIERPIFKEFDVTLPGKKIKMGHLHPLTMVLWQSQEIFEKMGFEIVEGPEIENEWYNFDALNIPKDHPARDMWNTLWLKPQNQKFHPHTKFWCGGKKIKSMPRTIRVKRGLVRGQKLLLRTHTSPVQVRYMEKNQPPLRMIVPGRVYRHEATDASHEINFYHVEGLMVDKKGKVNAANFKAIIEEFFNRFFKKEIEIRLKPDYFPFTEPSFEVDVSCPICNGRGCSACKNSGWVETLGAGMVHPNVFKNSGLNPKEWQGFAFGMGMDRLAMMKYKINDNRLFYGGDLRFLNQF